jgi:hypothetical protein
MLIDFREAKTNAASGSGERRAENYTTLPPQTVAHKRHLSREGNFVRTPLHLTDGVTGIQAPPSVISRERSEAALDATRVFELRSFPTGVQR